MTLQQPTYDATPIFCEQFAAFVEIGTFISFKEEGDKRKEVVGQILQVDMPSTVIVSIFQPFEDILRNKERPITEGPAWAMPPGDHTHAFLEANQRLWSRRSCIVDDVPGSDI
jgi:hypothetical protein